MAQQVRLPLLDLGRRLLARKPVSCRRSSIPSPFTSGKLWPCWRADWIRACPSCMRCSGGVLGEDVLGRLLVDVRGEPRGDPLVTGGRLLSRDSLRPLLKAVDEVLLVLRGAPEGCVLGVHLLGRGSIIGSPSLSPGVLVRVLARDATRRGALPNWLARGVTTPRRLVPVAVRPAIMTGHAP